MIDDFVEGESGSHGHASFAIFQSLFFIHQPPILSHQIVMSLESMDLREHLRITGGALHRWIVAQTYDAIIVGAMWYIGLSILHVPLAPLWAALGAVLQFVPNIGPVLALIGPVLTGAISGGGMRLIYVLILYAIIVVVDGLVLQPLLQKRANRVPIWASLLAPIVLGILIPFWGVLIAAPLLAVVYAYKAHVSGSSQPLRPPSGERM
jgi:predicted PurR-regulated permease PerM